MQEIIEIIQKENGIIPEDKLKISQIYSQAEIPYIILNISCQHDYIVLLLFQYYGFYPSRIDELTIKLSDPQSFKKMKQFIKKHKKQYTILNTTEFINSENYKYLSKQYPKYQY